MKTATKPTKPKQAKPHVHITRIPGTSSLATAFFEGKHSVDKKVSDDIPVAAILKHLKK